MGDFGQGQVEASVSWPVRCEDSKVCLSPDVLHTRGHIPVWPPHSLFSTSPSTSGRLTPVTWLPPWSAVGGSWRERGKSSRKHVHSCPRTQPAWPLLFQSCKSAFLASDLSTPGSPQHTALAGPRCVSSVRQFTPLGQNPHPPGPHMTRGSCFGVATW